MNDRLILAGNRGTGKAFQNYLLLGAIVAVFGLLMCFFGLSIKPYEARQIFGSNGEIIVFAMGMVGSAMLLLGIATPFLGRYQAKKCYIDVYETHVSGAYRVQQKGQVDQYIPFNLGYDKINSVSSDKNKVYLETASGRFLCLAYNATEICNAIRPRLH